MAQIVCSALFHPFDAVVVKKSKKKSECLSMMFNVGFNCFEAKINARKVKQIVAGIEPLLILIDEFLGDRNVFVQ